MALRYGHIKGGKNGDWLPIAASQKIHPNGGKVVYLDTSGHVTIAVSATNKIYGWAELPNSLKVGSTDASNGYWTSSSTAAADSCFVITDVTAVFEMPCYTGTSFADARVGETCDILLASADGTRQYAQPGTTTTDVLIVRGGPPSGATTSILISLNDDEMQRDT